MTTKITGKLRIVFYDWNSGHHGICPKPLQITSINQGEQMLKAISNAVAQGSYFRALIKNRKGVVSKAYYIAEDYVCEEELPEVDPEDLSGEK